MLWKPRTDYFRKEEGKKNKESLSFLEPGSELGKMFKKLPLPWHPSNLLSVSPLCVGASFFSLSPDLLWYSASSLHRANQTWLRSNSRCPASPDSRYLHCGQQPSFTKEVGADRGHKENNLIELGNKIRLRPFQLYLYYLPNNAKYHKYFKRGSFKSLTIWREKVYHKDRRAL